MDYTKQEVEYPLSIFEDDIYSLVLNKYQTATFNTNDLKEFIDLKILTQEELLNLYFTDKLLLCGLITNIRNTRIYRGAIEDLLKKSKAFNDEFYNLIVEKNKMIEKIRSISNETV